MLSDQVDGSLGANPLDGAAVVTAQQNTQVYELGWTTERRVSARKMEISLLYLQFHSIYSYYIQESAVTFL